MLERKWYPILFSSSMVRAILDGQKTQTRRVVKEMVDRLPCDYRHLDGISEVYGGGGVWLPLKEKYRIGNRLWVRETWSNGCTDTGTTRSDIIYRADGRDHDGHKWRPSIFMPRWASRITLEIVDVRVERLNAITEEDCHAEGIPNRPCEEGPIGEYATLWDSINGKKYPWNSNPWVWVVEFQKVKNTGDK